MRMLSLAFTPRFICYTLSILFAATLLLIILAVPQATYVAAAPLALFAGLSVLPAEVKGRVETHRVHPCARTMRPSASLS